MTKQTPSTPEKTRTCTACGQKKPLVAFLELAGTQGRSYGNICSTCRGSGLGDKKQEKTEAADTSGGTTRFQLDNKAKIQQEHDRLAEVKQKTEEDSVEKTKKDTLSLEKSTETEQLEKAEKKQREEYQDTQNQEATSRQKTEPQKTATAPEGKKLSTQSFYQEKTRAEKSQFINTAEINATAETLQNTNQQETKKTATSDISVIVIDEHTRTIGRSDESVFGRFREYLGKSAAINRGLEQYVKKTGPAATKHPSHLSGESAKGKTPEAPATTEKDLASEFLSNNLKRR